MLERTDISNQFYQGLIQEITDENFPTDPIAQEDEMFYRLGELSEENAISSEEALGCFTSWIKSRRDVHVVHIPHTISERAKFYE